MLLVILFPFGSLYDWSIAVIEEPIKTILPVKGSLETLLFN